MTNIKITTRGNAVKIDYRDMAKTYASIRINKNNLQCVNPLKASEAIRWEMNNMHIMVSREACQECIIIDDINGTTTWASASILADQLDALM